MKSLHNTYGDRPLRGLFRALSLMALLFYFGAAALMWRETLRETRASLTYINSMLAQSTRTTLKTHELILRGLAADLIAQGVLDDPEQGRLLIERMKTIDPGMAGFGLARPDGQLLLPTALLLVFFGGGLWAYRRAREQDRRAQARLQRSGNALLKRNESLSLINRFSRRLQGTLDLQDILDETLQALLGLKHPPHIAIYLLDDAGSELQLAAVHGFDDVVRRVGNRLPLQGSLSGLAITERRLLVADEISHDGRIEPAVQAALINSGAQSAMAIPIMYQDKALGSINLIYKSEQALSERSKETLRSLSNTVALV